MSGGGYVETGVSGRYFFLRDGDSGGGKTNDSVFVRVKPEWLVFQGGCTCFFAKNVCRGAGERAKI